MGQAEPQGAAAPSRGENRFAALRASLIAGAVYDAGFGIPVLFFPAWLADRLELQLPGEQVYLRLCGIFLLILAGFYLLTAWEPDRRMDLVVAAIVGRVMGAAYLGGYHLFSGGDGVFLLLGVMDLGFAILHAGAMGKRGWKRVTGFSRPRSSHRRG